jgi:Domain of unknown function (DUF6285)
VPAVEDRPTAPELLQAVADLLADDVQPVLEGALQHKVRVAANLCRIVERELVLGPAAADAERHALVLLLGREGTLAELNAELAEQLRSADEASLQRALPVLVAAVTAKLAVDKPGYADVAPRP